MPVDSHERKVVNKLAIRCIFQPERTVCHHRKTNLTILVSNVCTLDLIPPKVYSTKPLITKKNLKFPALTHHTYQFKLEISTTLIRLFRTEMPHEKNKKKTKR